MVPENTREHDGRWKSGASPNPGGRPAITREVRELAQKHSLAAVERLAELMHSDDERVAVSATTALLDRAVGKPTQALEVSGPEGAPINGLDLSRLSAEELRELQALTFKALPKGE